MPDAGPQPPGLKHLLSYPLIEAMQGRRTRRVAAGVSVRAEAGLLDYNDPGPTQPLDELEEAILICSTGFTGFITHDGPLRKRSGEPEDLGAMFLNLMGGAAPSPDNCQATSLFMINDDGIWFIKRPTPDEYLNLAQQLQLPLCWREWGEDHWITIAKKMKVPVHPGRISFPPEFPYYVGWNKQLSNPNGSTLFLPVLDCTRQYINILLGLLSEPEGQRPLFVDDWQPFRPKSLHDWGAWFAQFLGFIETIPYQPIGGTDRAQSGFVNKDIAIPLGFAGTFAMESELYFTLQNLMLLGEAMGLGVWGHSSLFPPQIFLRKPEKKWFGLGFRHEAPRRPKTYPFTGDYPKPMIEAPVPAWWDNPVGIDGIVQGLCPPYVRNMDEAVDTLLDEKKEGVYTNITLFSQPYKRIEGQPFAQSFLKQKQEYSQEAIRYTKEICNYIYDTYGRFPGHVNAFHAPGYLLQFHHIERGYYERFFSEDRQWKNQALHDKLWHS